MTHMVWRSDKQLSSSERVVMGNWEGYEPLQVAPAGNSLSVLIIPVLEQFWGLNHDHSNILGFTWLFIWIREHLTSAVSFLYLLTPESIVCVLQNTTLCFSFLPTLSFLHQSSGFPITLDLCDPALILLPDSNSFLLTFPTSIAQLAGTSFASSCAFFSISMARAEHSWLTIYFICSVASSERMWWYFRSQISLCLTNYVLKHSLISKFRKLLESTSCINLSDCQFTVKCFRFLFPKFMSTLLVSIIMYLVLNLALQGEDFYKGPLQHLIFFSFQLFRYCK